MYVCMYVRTYVCLSVCLSAYLSIYVCLSVWLSTYLSIYVFSFLPVFFLLFRFATAVGESQPSWVCLALNLSWSASGCAWLTGKLGHHFFSFLNSSLNVEPSLWLPLGRARSRPSGGFSEQRAMSLVTPTDTEYWHWIIFSVCGDAPQITNTLVYL